MSEEITWTKEYKLERYHKLNLTAEKGCVLFAGSSLMEMFPVEIAIPEESPVTRRPEIRRNCFSVEMKEAFLPKTQSSVLPRALWWGMHRI